MSLLPQVLVLVLQLEDPSVLDRLLLLVVLGFQFLDPFSIFPKQLLEAKQRRLGREERALLAQGLLYPCVFSLESSVDSS